MINISSMMTEWFATLASKLCGNRNEGDAKDPSPVSHEARTFERND